MNRHYLGVFCIAAATTCAAGQSFNIDFNSAQGIPPTTYGAAADQPGQWNLIANASSGHMVNLLSLDGLATTAVWTNITGNGLFVSTLQPIPPEHVALMRDGFDLGGAGAQDTFQISGLQNGTYDVYTYAWAADSASFFTGVSVNGLPVQSVGGDASAGLALGVTHALHTVTITDGTITINTSTITGFSTLNGVQIHLVPAPGALAFIALSGLCGVRRRRPISAR